MNSTEEKGIIELYRSVVDYHNNLVNIRFTVAILFFTGSAFLVNAVFSNNPANCNPAKGIELVPWLSLALTAFVIILEIRTMFLLKNLGALGGQIEEKLLANVLPFKVKWNDINGFFALMKDQPIQPLIPFAKSIISHTKGLFLIYISFLAFWIVLLCRR